jgi:FkbM family methyltransferase
LGTKEPATLAWIEAMPKDAVFWDVGANIGLYSLIAGRRGITTVAVEPGAVNYAALCRGIVANGLQETIFPLGVALSNKCIPSYIGFTHEAGQSTGHGVEIGVLKLSMDHLVNVFDLPRPTHIKIDTDGGDWNALVGCVGSLRSVKSVIIETHDGSDDRKRIGGLLKDEGFRMEGRHVSPLTPRSPIGMDHWFKS